MRIHATTIGIIILISILLPLAVFQPVNAQTARDQFNKGLNDTAAGTGHDKLMNFQDAASLPQTIGQIIKFLLTFLGVFFLGLIIYGGFLWMTDRGNEDQVKKARNVLQNAIIGLAIVLVAYGITSFVISAVIDKF